MNGESEERMNGVARGTRARSHTPAYNLTVNGGAASSERLTGAPLLHWPLRRQLESPRSARVRGGGGQAPTLDVTWRQQWRLGGGAAAVWGGGLVVDCGGGSCSSCSGGAGDLRGEQGRRRGRGGCYKSNYPRHMHT